MNEDNRKQQLRACFTSTVVSFFTALVGSNLTCI